MGKGVNQTCIHGEAGSVDQSGIIGRVDPFADRRDHAIPEHDRGLFDDTTGRLYDARVLDGHDG